jgi:hypothetical protein
MNLERDKKDDPLLPCKIGDRLLLSVFCSVLAFFFAAMIFALRGKPSKGWLDLLLHELGIDTMFTFCIFSFLGMIWALFTPHWLESLLDKSFKKVLATIAVVLAATVFTIIYIAC